MILGFDYKNDSFQSRIEILFHNLLADIEFYHLVIHPSRPISKWCMWCFGERFGAEDMEKQSKVYLKNNMHQAGYPYSLLWEFPTKDFKNVSKKTLSTISVKDFSVLSKTPDYIEDMIR